MAARRRSFDALYSTGVTFSGPQCTITVSGCVRDDAGAPLEPAASPSAASRSVRDAHPRRSVRLASLVRSSTLRWPHRVLLSCSLRSLVCSLPAARCPLRPCSSSSVLSTRLFRPHDARPPRLPVVAGHRLACARLHRPRRVRRDARATFADVCRGRNCQQGLGFGVTANAGQDRAFDRTIVSRFNSATAPRGCGSSIADGAIDIARFTNESIIAGVPSFATGKAFDIVYHQLNAGPDGGGPLRAFIDKTGTGALRSFAHPI